MAAIMSPLVTWPCLPVPAIAPVSTPLSAAILRTDGGIGAATTGAGAGFGGSLGLAAATSVATLAAASAPSLIWPSSAPTATVSPSLAEISDKTPAAGAGTSSVTLSVSNSTTGSSTATASPGCLNHLPTVASVTDSPRVGTRMSVITISSRVVGRHFRMTHEIHPSASSRNCLSCARCLDICPTAVEADAGRPA